MFVTGRCGPLFSGSGVPLRYGGALDIRSTPSVPLIRLSLLSLMGIKAGRLGHT